jgi:hypothetical protein
MFNLEKKKEKKQPIKPINQGNMSYLNKFANYDNFV